ncbi:MAG: hypothetical protein ACJAS1_000516 [Oleiphilaceae bacterium]|jgi:hypothetical protein
MANLRAITYFNVPVSLVDNREAIKNLKCFTEHERRFVDCLLTIAVKKKTPSDNKFEDVLIHEEIFIEGLKSLNHPNSQSIIIKRIGDLKKMGAIKTAKSRTTDSKINTHTLLSLADMLTLPEKIVKEKKKNEKRRTQQMVVAHCDFLKSNQYIVLNGKENDKAYHERLMNGLLDAAMKMSAKDKRTEITVKIDVAGSPLTIVAKTIGDNAELTRLPDQRCQRAIISLIRNEIDKRVAKLKSVYGLDYPANPADEYTFRKEQINNLFAVDINELCDELKLPRYTINMNLVREMMSRLANTVYDIDASENEWFKRVYSLSGKSEHIRVQFLQNFEQAYEPPVFNEQFNLKDRKPLAHIYTFSLDLRCFIGLIDPDRSNVFVTHKGMITEKSGIVQRAYNWCRGFIGGTDKSYLVGRAFSLHELHLLLVPAARYDNFYQHFIRQLRRFSVDEWKARGVNKSIIYGYVFTFDNSSVYATVKIERDKTDEIVGDNSEHQRLLKRA